MKKMILAIGAAATVAVAGLAVPAANATAGLHAHISPTAPSAGTQVKTKATGARAGQQYACVNAIGHKHIQGSQSLADVNSAVITPASSTGVVKCLVTFQHFTGTYKGRTHSCPPTRKDKAHNWYCGVAVANFNNHDEHTLAKFTF